MGTGKSSVLGLALLAALAVGCRSKLGYDVVGAKGPEGGAPSAVAPTATGSGSATETASATGTTTSTATATSTVTSTGGETSSGTGSSTSTASSTSTVPSTSTGTSSSVDPDPITRARGLSGSVEGAARTADGGLVVVGDFQAYGGHRAGRIARILPDGTLDATFAANVGSGFGYAPLTVAVDGSGRILVGGSFTTFDGAAAPYLVRLNADGTRDASFVAAIGAGPDHHVNDVAVDGAGKIVLVGSFTSFDGTPRARIVRLGADGALDATFDPGTGFNGAASRIHFGTGGKIYVGGSNFTTYAGTSRARLARLDADGSLDTGFDIGSGFDGFVYAIREAADGKVYAGGWFRTVNGVAKRRLARLNADGSLDATFNASGAGLGPASANGESVYAIHVRADGKLLVGGSFREYNDVPVPNNLILLEPDGALASSFASDAVPSNLVRYVFPEASSGALIAGNFASFKGRTVMGLARIDATGELQAPFDGGGAFDADALGLDVRADGRIVVVGSFVSYGRTSFPRIARLTPAGEADGTFLPGAGFNSYPYAVVSLPDDKIVAAGLFSSYRGASVGRIARLDADGGLDASFDSGTGFNGIVRDLEPAGGGKLYAGGGFTQYDGQPAPYVARLLADGSLDTTFAVGAGFSGGGVLGVKVDANGKVYVVGSFTQYQGAPAGRIVRLHPDGSRDASFDAGAGFDGTASVVHLAPSGGIFVGGAFTGYDGAPVKRLVKLAPDGSLDASFASATLTAGDVYSIHEDTTGKVYGCGYGLSVGGVAVPSGLIKFHGDGTRDVGFALGTASTQLNERCYQIAPNPTGDRLYVAGYLRNAFGDRATGHFLRIRLDGSPD